MLYICYFFTSQLFFQHNLLIFRIFLFSGQCICPNTFSGLFFLSVFIFWMFLHNIYSFNKYFSFCCVPGTRILGTRITAVKRADKNSSSHVVYSVVGVDNISPLGHILPAAYFVNNVPPCSLGLAYFVTFLSPNYS